MSLTHDEIFHAFHLPEAGQGDDKIIITHLMHSNIMDMHLSLGGHEDKFGNIIFSNFSNLIQSPHRSSQRLNNLNRSAAIFM